MEMGNGNSHHFHTATDTGNRAHGSSDVFYAKRTARSGVEYAQPWALMG